MNKTILTLFIASTFAFAQKNQPSSTPVSNSADNGYGIKEKVFREALKFGDLVVAKSALYEMIALKPAEKTLKDSLALVYINLGQPQQAILLTRDILAENPTNLGMLEVKAIAQQSIGMSKEALADYENLYGKQKNIFHLYQIATLQYDLKRIAECNSSIDQLLNSPDADKKEMAIGVGGNRGEQQKVFLKAAALNIKGVLAMDLNEIAIAKTCFDEALKLNPDFVLAKNNAEFLQKKSQPASKSTTIAPKSQK